MTSNEYRLATIVGKYFKDNDTEDIREWTYEKEMATIAEKAIKFSERSKKPLEECIDIKIDEMKKGYILVKNHDMDDYTRGIISGYLVGVYEGNEDILYNVELKWRAIQGTVDISSPMLAYYDFISDYSKKRAYHNKGLITVQELTKICLNLMDNGMSEKFIVMNNNGYKFLGASTVDIDDSIDFDDNELKKNDLIMMW